jgi:hypothetical protein
MLFKRNPPPQPENYRLLPVDQDSYALIDPETCIWAIRYHWRLVKSSHVAYVARRYVREGKTCTIRLHVEIMHPPPGYEVHHKDRNPLNCLRSNLENVTPSYHRQLHGKAS